MKQLSIEETYYPKEWNDLILPSGMLDLLNKKRETKGYRLLLYSTPGTGKTTTARLLTKNDEVKYISGSNDFKIDVVRNVIYPFVTDFSVMGKQKTLIIDEFSGVRGDLQEAFKIILDQAKNVNFIFITNEIEKVNDAVFSRFTKLDYDFVGSDLDEQKKNFITFAIKVCTEQKIKFDKDGMRKLFQLNFPNFRNLLIHLDEIKDKGKDVTIETIKLLSDNGKQDTKLYEIILSPSIVEQEFYEEITKYKGKEKEALLSLGEPFFQYLNDKGMFSKTLESAIIISKYSETFVTSINKYVTFLSAIVELKTLFR